MDRKPVNIEFGARLKAARNAKGMTLQQVADALHIGLRSYQNYEAGDRCPSLDGLIAISRTLDVSVDSLLGL